MGANFCTMTLPGSKTRAEVTAAFEQKQQSDGWEHGHSYSGSFSEFRGLIITPHTFASEREAEEWLMENTYKWEEAKAVRFRKVETVTTREPTFEGQPRARVGGSFDPQPVFVTHYDLGKARLILADQLTGGQVQRLLKSREVTRAAEREYRIAHGEFSGLVRALTDTDVTFSYTNLRRSRTAYWKAKRAFDAARAKHEELLALLRKRLYATTQKDRGEFWLIGGWASS